MLPEPTVEIVPLKMDEHGVIRVGRTRVTLETVLATYNDGASAEEIVHKYPSLSLADVYSVIAYYLRHRTSLDDYLRRSETEATAIRRDYESKHDLTGIRERLLARQLNKD